MEVDSPRLWDDAALAEWATPIAALNSPRALQRGRVYRAPQTTCDLSGLSPHTPGYWGWLQAQPPGLVDKSRMRSDADWIRPESAPFATSTRR